MGRKGPPPPVATGKASLLHYFSSSPSVRTDSASAGSSSPARAGPSRANSLPHANATSSSLGRGKPTDESTPRAPLRATQSLGSLEAARRDAPQPPVVASASSSSGAPPQVPAEESEEDYRPPRSFVKAESLTPRRNPPRLAARNSSPAPSPTAAAFTAPRSPRASESMRKGKEKAVETGSDAELATHVKMEKRGSVDPLNLCTPSPAKRARQRAPKKIFSFTIDEKGRDRGHCGHLTSTQPGTIYRVEAINITDSPHQGGSYALKVALERGVPVTAEDAAQDAGDRRSSSGNLE
ncbi:hypothetical protein B0A53_00312 [Rhodotorula sp. CCFEE 5036]|nr:hypothetical protein B0A53_00312 [Rhodotorula sp. CCFEE 5036]